MAHRGVDVACGPSHAVTVSLTGDQLTLLVTSCAALPTGLTNDRRT